MAQMEAANPVGLNRGPCEPPSPARFGLPCPLRHATCRGGLTIMPVCPTVRVFSLLAGGRIASPAPAKSLAIVDALVYPSATAAPLPHASVLMQDGRIVAVGERIQIPAGAEVIRCSGCAVMAGFWNCHIHFTEPKWENAAAQPAQKLAEQLQSMRSEEHTSELQSLRHLVCR